MNGDTQSEQLQNFQQRLNQWISDQGFWFQLRYSLVGVGNKGSWAFHMLRLFVRLIVFVVIIGGGCWLFLMMQTGSARYTAKLRNSLQRSFAAEKIELIGFKHTRDEFYINRIAMLGGEKTFFKDLEIRHLKCRMGILDQLSKSWAPGLIEINKMDMEIWGGSESEISSNAIADVLFQETKGVVIEQIQVKDASIRWGYSERTRGQVIGSRLNLNRVDGGWKVILRGGTFSQNWLRRLEIVEIEALVGRDGIIFEKGSFKKGDGTVTTKNLEIKSGLRPEISGSILIRNMDVVNLMPIAVRGYVEGKLSGEFNVIGSTNSSDGVGFDGDILLGVDDALVLRDQIPILRAISVVDAFNNYRRLNFTDGTFGLKSHGGQLVVSDINLKAGDLIGISGEFLVRTPTAEELEEMGERGEGKRGTILEDEELDEVDETITLRKAAESKDGKKAGFEEDSIFDQLGLNLQMRRYEELATERLAGSMRYEGNLILSLKKDAFSRAPQLDKIYPVSPETGRVAVDVPLEGIIYDLTLDQSGEIYRQGER